MIEEFDNATEACPHCGAKNFAKVLGVLYSYPTTMKFKCLFCHREYTKTFGGIRILRGEEAVRKRPQMYIGHPEWGELAQELIDEQEAKDNPNELTCLDIANGLGHDQAKCIGIPLTDKLLMRTWEKRKKEGKKE